MSNERELNDENLKEYQTLFSTHLCLSYRYFYRRANWTELNEKGMLPGELPRLERLKISQISNEDLDVFFRKMVTPTRIELKENSKRYYSWLHLQKFSNLRSLKIPNSPNLTSDQLLGVIKQAPMLRTLNISGCNQINNYIIYFLSESSPQLRHLNINNTQIALDLALQIPNSFKELRSLQIAGFTPISLIGFSSMKNIFPKLLYLNASSKPNLTGDAITTFLTFHKKTIQRIDLDGCKKITDSFFSIIQNECQELKILNIRECSAIPPASIRDLRLALPRLQIGLSPEQEQLLQALDKKE